MDWSEKISIIKDVTGLKSVELAKILNVRQPYISELETGKSKNPKSAFIQALISELHVNPYWLFLGEGEVIEQDRTPQPQYEEIKILKEMTLYEAIQVLQKLEERDKKP